MCIYDKDPMYLKIELKLTTVTSILKIDGFDWFCKWLFVTPFTSCNVAIDDRKKSLNFLILRKNQANMLDSDISFRDEKVLSFYISWLEISYNASIYIVLTGSYILVDHDASQN